MIMQEFRAIWRLPHGLEISTKTAVARAPVDREEDKGTGKKGKGKGKGKDEGKDKGKPEDEGSGKAKSKGRGRGRRHAWHFPHGSGYLKPLLNWGCCVNSESCRIAIALGQLATNKCSICATRKLQDMETISQDTPHAPAKKARGNSENTGKKNATDGFLVPTPCEFRNQCNLDPLEQIEKVTEIEQLGKLKNWKIEKAEELENWKRWKTQKTETLENLENGRLVKL